MPSCSVAPLRVSAYPDECWPCDVAGHAVSRRTREPGTGCHRGSRQSRTSLFIPIGKAIRHAITRHQFKGHASQDLYRTQSSGLLPLPLLIWLWVGGGHKDSPSEGEDPEVEGRCNPPLPTRDGAQNASAGRSTRGETDQILTVEEQLKLKSSLPEEQFLTESKVSV